MGMLGNRIMVLANKTKIRHSYIDQDALRDFYKKDVIRRFGDENMPPEGTPEWDKWYELMGVKDWYQIGVSQGDCTPERAVEAIEDARKRIYGEAKKKKDWEHISNDETRKRKNDLVHGGPYGVSFGKDKDGYFCYTHRARSKSYPTIADIPKSALKFIDSTGMKKVEGKAEVYLGESGLDQTWQNEFPANAKCHRCGGNARVAFVMKENDPDIAAIHDFNHEGADGGPLWLHDAGSFATYLCGKCLEPTTLYNQAMKAEAKKDTVASALEFLMSMPLYERDRNEGATVAEEIASSKHGLGPESHRIYDALCLLFVDKNAGLMFGDMPISDALDKLKEMGYDGVTRRKTEGHEPVTAAKSKTLHIWDFDGTLVDTGEFNQDRIDDPKPIKKNIDRFKRLIDDDADVIVMTARSNAGLVRRTLEDLGVEMVGIRIIALGDPEATAKGEYIAKNLASRYDTITLYDDRQDYLDAAKEAMEGKPAKFITVKAALVSDAEYLAAVERGDMETAQRMVDAAAKAAGYTVGPVYHGTNSKFNVFKPQFGKAIWFSEDREKIARGDSGASGTQRIVPVFLKATNPAGWKEYDKLLEMQIISNGFDSVHLDDDWIVYSPSQIKSAEPVVYNNFGKVVPLSKRFNSSSNDIRAMRVEASGSPSYLPTIEQTLEYMDSSHEGAYYDLYPAYSEPVVDGEDDYAYDTKEKAYQQAEFILDILGGLPDPVDAWRAIYAKDVDSIRKDWLGESWSFEKEAALEFGSHARANFLLHAKIPRSAIDWDRTVREFTQNSSDPSSGESEFEVVVDDFDKIHDLEIYQIKGMKKVARRNMTATTTKKYQITHADGTCAFRDMTPNHAESMRGRDGVAAVTLMDLPDEKVEAGNKNKGEYDLWGSIEKAVERGLLAYVGFMAADYLHQKKNASFGLENYRPVIDAYGEIGHSDKLTDEDKSVILKRLNDAGWDASDEGIEFLWDEILRHRQIAS